MKRFLKSFKFAKRGIFAVIKEEKNFQIEIIVGTATILFGIFFKFTYIELSFIFICVTIVLCGEMVNTAIEDLCNKIESNQNETIAKIKDIMAGFVLLSSLGSTTVGILIFFHHFF